MNPPSMFKAFIRHNGFGISRTPTTPKIDPLWSFPLPFKFFSTTTSSDYAVSYLINKCGFSPQSALKASKNLRFQTSQKPDSVLTFFRNHAFPDTVTYTIIKRGPWLLSCYPNKRLLPKFQFLLSIGASSSDIVRIVTGAPKFLQVSLKNLIIPNYKLVNTFLQSDEKTLASLLYCPSLLSSNNVASNVKLLLDNGVASSNIFRILRLQPFVISRFCTDNLEKTVLELKNLAFDPSKSYFAPALLAKIALSKSQWNEKIDTFKSWKWSEETISEAFRRQPNCMLASKDKINRVMKFWVKQLGWDSSYLVKGPGIFGYSLENRIIPRALVIQYLLSKGLRSKSASLLTPFYVSEELFLENFVKRFQEEETSWLLKLYKGKMNVEDERAQGNCDMS